MTPRWRPARLPVRPALALILLAVLWASVPAWNHVQGNGSALDRVEAALADLRLSLAGTRAAPSSIVVVAVDDRTVAAEGGYPLPRATLAELVARIGQARPKALAVDILLVDPGEPPADAALARALRSVPHVLAAAGTFERALDGPRPDLPETAGELWPNAAFFDPDAVGLVNVATDASGSPRFLPLAFATTRGLVPGFALRAASLLRGLDPVLSPEGLRFGETRLPLDLGRHLPLRPLGPGGTVPTLSARDLLAGTVPPALLANKLVVVGVTATAVGDTFNTVFDPVVPGVEILATGIASLVGGETLVRDRTIRLVDGGATLFAAGTSAALLAFAPLAPAIAAVALLMAVWLGAAIVFFAHGVWIAMALPLFGVLPPLALVVGARRFVQKRSVARLARAEDEFRRFQPPAFAERLRIDPDFLSSPVEREAGILFVDLAGFTHHSENLDSRKVHDFLSRYHSLVETVADAHGGTVLNFMGDGAMILFGAPDPRGDDPARTLAAAFALRAEIESWIAAAGWTSLGVRFGCHWGRVVLSRLGHEAHQQITASGDTVNVAARLMEVAKHERAVIAASRDLLDAAGDAATALLPAASGSIEVPIRGREGSKRVAVWR